MTCAPPSSTVSRRDPGMIGSVLARYHGTSGWIVVGACIVALAPSGLRWLRVAQREHYLAGSAPDSPPAGGRSLR